MQNENNAQLLHFGYLNSSRPSSDKSNDFRLKCLRVEVWKMEEVVREGGEEDVV